MSATAVIKLNCEKCKLKTEHQRLITATDQRPQYKCLRCGTIRESDSDSKNYPVDNSQPAGVG